MTFRKACECVGTATTGQLRITQPPLTVDYVTWKFKVALIPGPSCDVCGRAWIASEPEDPRLVQAR